jgi:ADP-L-glycero-D-manno-heptose 6-epimerase
MGAISATTETDADLVWETNVRLTLDLADWCTRHTIPFITASSAATYGDGAAGFEDDPSPEGLARLRPLNPYGWSKWYVDRTLARRARRRSIRRRTVPRPGDGHERVEDVDDGHR